MGWRRVRVQKAQLREHRDFARFHPRRVAGECVIVALEVQHAVNDNTGLEISQ